MANVADPEIEMPNDNALTQAQKKLDQLAGAFREIVTWSQKGADPNDLEAALVACENAFAAYKAREVKDA